MQLLASVFILAVASWRGSQAFSGGPPPSACLSLFPLHGVEKQTGPSPYRMLMSSSTYLPDQTLTLTVVSTGGRQFMGYQVTAHRARSSGNHQQFVGTFTATEASSQTMDCLRTPRSMVTHKNASLKTSVIFDWTAPNMNLGDLQFLLTVVESRAVFWIRMSVPLQAASSMPVVPPLTTVSSVLLSSRPPNWSSCYRDKGCWLVPESRRGQCDMTRGECLAALSYRLDVGKVHFELSYKREGQYFALGLSDDQLMGDDLAVVCTALPGHEAVHLGFNHGVPGPYKYFFRQFSTGLSDLAVGQADGHSYCKFSLATSVSVLNMTLSRNYHLMQRHYLFLSWGRVFQGTDSVYGHSGAPAVSENPVYLMDREAFYSSAVSHAIAYTLTLASVVLAVILH
ncbi:hypothetical protein ACOMHN_030486 [Nucella lapillus]